MVVLPTPRALQRQPAGALAHRSLPISGLPLVISMGGADSLNFSLWKGGERGPLRRSHTAYLITACSRRNCPHKSGHVEHSRHAKGSSLRPKEACCC